ncbi:MAG: Gfo/Idh/MocA family oxidoreductase [Henriciella sp.]|uniref:Gfo/Idh/MocA family protein n=1 Tax=Henriciella sp. TaxID=1968823 RepID=UPI0032F03B9A
MNRPYTLALVGIGQIARAQHIPVIRQSPHFELSCVVSSSTPELGVPVYSDLASALKAQPDIDAVVLCTPPRVRLELARTAFEAGCSVMLEKPPARTTEVASQIERTAAEAACTLFASWHSRFAPMVAEALRWTRGREIVSGTITWHEDVRKWHPGQRWLWEEGGMGVYDPGINAFSILTLLHPAKYMVERAVYQVPENACTPVAVDMKLKSETAAIDVSLDFRFEQDEMWKLSLRDSGGEELELSQGGAALSINAGTLQQGESREYEGVYEHFASMLADQQSDFDLAPMYIVEQADGLAECQTVAPVYN